MSVRVHQKASEFIKLLREKHSKQNKIPHQNSPIFLFREKLYNLRSKSSLKRKKVNTVYFDSKNVLSLETKIWELMSTKKNKTNYQAAKVKLTLKTQINARTKSMKHISVK